MGRALTVTWRERLEALRGDLKWFAIECCKDDQPDCAAAFIAADIMVRDAIGKLHDEGLQDEQFDREPDAPL